MTHKESVIFDGGSVASFPTRCSTVACGKKVAFPVNPICKFEGFGSLSRGLAVRSFSVNCSFQMWARPSRVNIFFPRE